MSVLPTQLAELIAHQDGVVSRRQLMEGGLTRSQAIQQARTRRWQRVHPGVFATYTGPLTNRARVHAALLAAGPGAAVAYETALWLWGFTANRPGILQICVPLDRMVKASAGVHISRRSHLAELVQPGRNPARIRFEACILDIADRSGSLESVIGVVLSAIQRRFTTAARLMAELATRSRHRWRALISDVLAEAKQGVASPLERRYLRDVERPHGLPRGRRNKRRATTPGHPYYDVDYWRWNVIAELDGRAAHPPEGKFRDWSRDNAAAVLGAVVQCPPDAGFHDREARAA